MSFVEGESVIEQTISVTRAFCKISRSKYEDENKRKRMKESQCVGTFKLHQSTYPKMKEKAHSKD